MRKIILINIKSFLILILLSWVPMVASADHSVTVVRGDTLQSISQRLFGTTRKWYKIYKANQNILSSPNLLSIGTVLNISGSLEAMLTSKDCLKVCQANQSAAKSITSNATEEAVLVEKAVIVKTPASLTSTIEPGAIVEQQTAQNTVAATVYPAYEPQTDEPLKVISKDSDPENIVKPARSATGSRNIASQIASPLSEVKSPPTQKPLSLKHTDDLEL